MSLKRFVAALVIVLTLSALGYWAYLQFLAPGTEDSKSQQDPIDPVTVDIGASLVSAEGNIIPLRHANLSFQSGGRAAEILVAAGDQVSQGEPLVRLEAAELEASLRQAEAGVLAASSNLDSAHAGLAVSQQNVALAQANVQAADAQLALLKSDPLAEELIVAESNVALAESGIEQAEANRQVVLEIPDSRVRAAEAMVAAAAAESRLLQEQYDGLIRNDIGGSPEEQARFALNAAVANLAASQVALDELNSGATFAQRRLAGSTVLIASSQKQLAEAQLALLMAGAKEEQIGLLEVGVAQAEAAVVQAEAMVRQAETVVAQAEAGLMQAEASVSLVLASLDKRVLLAPFDGTIAGLHVKEGETVAPGVQVVTLADFTDWLVETTDMGELDVVAVAVGAPVTVRIDAIPQETFTGIVTAIADTSSLTRGDVTYAVTVRIEETGRQPLRWGMSVFVDVETGP